MNRAADYDVLIVGGGIVGASLACALGNSELKVGVIEGRPPPALVPSTTRDYDLRVSAVTWASQTVFENLGVWEGIRQHRTSPIQAMHVWDAGGTGAIHFDSAEIGAPCLGFIIENGVILTALWQGLRTYGNIELLCPAEVKTLSADEATARVQLHDGRVLQARLLVGADGAQSQVRAQARIALNGWPYPQSAIVATVTTALDHQATAWQRFLPTGPLAFLPLDTCRCSIVWSLDADRAESLLKWEDPAFLQALQEAFGGSLGRIQSVSARAAFPLSRHHAETYVRARLALIGDAAHNIHPLAGQGVNLGIADAAALAEVVRDAHRARKDIGAYPTLRRYERWRKGDNLLMLAVTDGFYRLFGAALPPVKWLRNKGLNLVDALGPLKRAIMRQASGIQGDLPRLSKTRFI